MQFERLKKNHQKQVIIGGLILVCIISAITITTTKAKYEIANDLELAKGTINYKAYDFKIMAMYKSDDKTNYTEIEAMPSEGYTVNEEKSYCTTDNVTQVKGRIRTEDGKHYFTNLSKNDKCYVWFDKKQLTGSEKILSVIGDNVKIQPPNYNSGSRVDDGIYVISDGVYGNYSYYWRGATTTNHLIFADKCWRIVRINGDNTIRLIYNGPILTNNTCPGNGKNNNSIIAEQNYNSNNSASDVGWTYVRGKQRPETGDTIIDSDAKIKTEKWYNDNFEINENYSSKIVSGKFCNDRNMRKGNEWKDPTSSYQAHYAADERFSSSGYFPTLSCPMGDVYYLKVGLITADEVMFAGGEFGGNTEYYLYNGTNYWTMTPSLINGSTIPSLMYIVASNGYLASSYVSGIVSNTGVNNSYGIRPVINLKSDITFSGGDGTLNNPYIVAD